MNQGQTLDENNIAFQWSKILKNAHEQRILWTLINNYSQPSELFYPRAASILIHTYFLWKAVKVLSLCRLELNDVHNFPLTKGEKKILILYQEDA